MDKYDALLVKQIIKINENTNTYHGLLMQSRVCLIAELQKSLPNFRPGNINRYDNSEQTKQIDNIFLTRENTYYNTFIYRAINTEFAT